MHEVYEVQMGSVVYFDFPGNGCLLLHVFEEDKL